MKKIPLSRDQLWKNVLEQARQPNFFENNHLFSRRTMLAKGFNGIGTLGLAAAISQQASEPSLLWFMAALRARKRK